MPDVAVTVADGQTAPFAFQGGEMYHPIAYANQAKEPRSPTPEYAEGKQSR